MKDTLVTNEEREHYAELVQAEQRANDTEAAVQKHADGFDGGAQEHRICWAITKEERLSHELAGIRLKEPYRSRIDAALPAYKAFDDAKAELEELRKSYQDSEFVSVRERAWAEIDAAIGDLERYDKANGSTERQNWHNYIYAL